MTVALLRPSTRFASAGLAASPEPRCQALHERDRTAARFRQYAGRARQ